uniref:Uncharacterized protein K0048F05.16 n=1 Tax=Oryza sativa subsp. indica TaxID=39946 RepID=C8TF05_ORYSI|nr:hypothetical protein [Oryza sativa Indica Group]
MSLEINACCLRSIHAASAPEEEEEEEEGWHSGRREMRRGVAFREGEGESLRHTRGRQNGGGTAKA